MRKQSFYALWIASTAAALTAVEFFLIIVACLGDSLGNVQA
jgi:hypothetical protein